MKQSKELLIVLSLVVAAVGVACSARVDVEAERQALRNADAEYSKAGTAKDFERVFALYSDSAVIYPPNTPSVTGKDNVHKFALDFAAIPGLALNFQPLEVQVSSAGDLGYTVNIVDLKMNDPQGNPISEKIRDIHFWKKEANGQWRVVIDIWNSEQPVASPAASEPNK